MSKSRWLAAGLICSLGAMPMISNAQTASPQKEQADDFVKDVLRALAGPNWNAFLHAGLNTNDRYLLQRALNPLEGERALNSSNGFNFGLGAGVDILLRMGFRASYTYSSSNLDFRTDNGNGSDALNIDDVGTLKSHTATLEVMRYMLPSRARITPYGSFGIQGTWWVLDEKTPLVTSQGASTPFSIGPLFSFGMQFKVADQVSTRLEWMASSGRNPFTGNRSFRAAGGTTIDEPTGVNRTDFRLAGVYYFGKAKTPTTTTPVAHK